MKLHHIHLSDDQIAKVLKAHQNGKGLSLKVDRAGEVPFVFHANHMKRLASGNDKPIKFSASHIKKVIQHGGSFWSKLKGAAHSTAEFFRHNPLASQLVTQGAERLADRFNPSGIGGRNHAMVESGLHGVDQLLKQVGVGLKYMSANDRHVVEDHIRQLHHLVHVKRKPPVKRRGRVQTEAHELGMGLYAH